MSDMTVTRPIGIMYDLLVKVVEFIFHVDFIILDHEVEFEVFIILGRPFSAIEHELVDFEMEIYGLC